MQFNENNLITLSIQLHLLKKCLTFLSFDFFSLSPFYHWTVAGLPLVVPEPQFDKPWPTAHPTNSAEVTGSPPVVCLNEHRCNLKCEVADKSTWVQLSYGKATRLVRMKFRFCNTNRSSHVENTSRPTLLVWYPASQPNLDFSAILFPSLEGRLAS
jgi:hypothetical protein